MALRHRAYDAFFKAMHGNRLIYNSCWEDPRADRELLQLNADSRLVMITSAGCNALDYLLDDPAQIHCIDLNPRQNALLELKLALLRQGDFDALFQLFGLGWHNDFQRLYLQLRSSLSLSARCFWDRNGALFDRSGRGSFYFRGAAGDVAYAMYLLLRRLRPGLRRQVLALLEATDLAEQKRLYAQIEPKLWGALLRWFVRQPATLTLLGVPRAQRALIEGQYPGGVPAYVQDKLRYLLTEIPIRDNYFWRVYITGSYTPDCCPNYLRAEHFQTLRARAERIRLHTCSVADFLQSGKESWSHFVMLDHQDWMAAHAPEALAEEWRLILQSSNDGARILMRSAGLSMDFLPEFVQQRLVADHAGAEHWHRRDRVGTYGSVLSAGLAPLAESP